MQKYKIPTSQQVKKPINTNLARHINNRQRYRHSYSITGNKLLSSKNKVVIQPQHIHSSCWQNRSLLWLRYRIDIRWWWSVYQSNLVRTEDKIPTNERLAANCWLGVELLNEKWEINSWVQVEILGVMS